MPTATVDTPSASYSEQAVRWDLGDSLWGGTLEMRRQGEKYLPKEPMEKDVNYWARRDRSILFNAFRETIETAASRPFSKPITLHEADKLDERLRLIENNADAEGTSLTQFSRSLFIDGCRYGRFHFLVDFPATDATAKKGREQKSGVRPNFALVSPTNLIAWKFRRGDDGSSVLEWIRVREMDVVPDGEYGERPIYRIRVLREKNWSLFEKSQDGNWVEVDSGPVTLGRVPLITGYFAYVGQFQADVPFEALAWLNLAHWQSYSDQRNLLRVARVPILTATGIGPDEFKDGITVGANNILRSTRPEAKFGYTEHSGAALAAGDTDLKGIEERMEVLGLAPSTSRSGVVTATAKAIDESKASSDLQAWARVTESALLQGYEMAAEWISTETDKVELPEKFKPDVWSDFGLTITAAEDMAILQADRARGDLSHATYLSELVRRKKLPENLDIEAEIERAKADMPLGMIPGVGGFGADDDPDPDDEDEDAEDEPKPGAEKAA